jgi:hypothetical protein
MKPFHFSLQAVRTLRQRQEQMALERFTAAVQNREKAVNRLNTVTQQLHAGWSELKALLSKGATALQIAQIQAYCDSDGAKKECESASMRPTAPWTPLGKIWWRQSSSSGGRKYYENQRRLYERELDRKNKTLTICGESPRNEGACWHGERRNHVELVC